MRKIKESGEASRGREEIRRKINLTFKWIQPERRMKKDILRERFIQERIQSHSTSGGCTIIG